MSDTATTPFRRELGLRHLVVMGLTLIGPLAPVSIFGPIDATSNGAAALVYVIACVAMGFTAASYATMAREVPRAGSVFAYASAGIGRRTGFMAGWMILLDYVLVPGLCYLVAGLALNSFVPSIPVWVFTLAALLITTALNLLGARWAARAGTLVIVVEAAVLVVIVAGAIHFLGDTGSARAATSPFTGVDGLQLDGALEGVSIAVLSFLGFDAITSFAEENAGKPNQIGKATLICLALIGLLFVLQTYLGSLINPSSPAELRDDPGLQGAAFYDAVRASIDGWVATALGSVKAVGAAFAAMIAMAASSRLIFAMARAGRLPAILASGPENARVPVNAVILTAGLTMAIAVPASLFDSGLAILSSLVSVGALSAFVVLHASTFAYFRNRPQRRLTLHVAVPIIGALVNLGVLASASQRALLIGAAWLALGLVALVTGRGDVGRRDQSRSATARSIASNR